jgi:hypothetical protein
MLSERRQKLLDAQRALALALQGGGEVPKGFEPERVALAAEGLRFKRAQAAARAWPALKRNLGEGFAREFAAYAASCATPETPRKDSLGFATFLAERGRLPNRLWRVVQRERLGSHLRRVRGMIAGWFR